MLEYFITFVIIGFVLGLILSEDLAGGVITIISILWIFVAGPWAIATFFELAIGVGIASSLKK